MFTIFEKETALKMYEEIVKVKVKGVIQKLGYPTRETLYNWLKEKRNPIEIEIEKVPRKRINNSPVSPRCIHRLN